MSFHALVTGGTGFIGRRLVTHLAARESRGRVTLLVLAPEAEAAARWAASVPGAQVDVVSGDVADLHLGLSAREYDALAATVTHVFHLAATSSLDVPRETAFRVNVEGTRNVLELARECRHLRRLVHFSTCAVAGDRVGVIAEDELECGQGFRNVYEETKFQAERLVERAKGALPITILRPSTVVGDSATGEVDRFEGPYYLGMALVLSPLVTALPLPGGGVAPLHVVPVDWLVQAACALAQGPGAEGKTLQLVDPHPMSARRVYELVASRAHKKLPRFALSARAADLFLRLPLVEKMTRPQRAAIQAVNHLAFYDCREASALLDAAGLPCPPLQTYLERIIDFALEAWRSRQQARATAAQAEETEDPLDVPPRGEEPVSRG